LTHGFDEFYGWKSQTIAHTYYPSTFVYNGSEIPLAEGEYLHDIIMERALAFVERNALSNTPFFCYIPTAVPHAAMHAPKVLHDKWRKVFPEFDDKVGRYKAGAENCPDVQNPIAGFAAMMENLDNQVGAILDRLEALGVADDTLVMFTSDNGAHHEGGHDPKFWNSSGSLRGYKRDMHEGGIRTPMLARWPNTIEAGTQNEHISAFWDVMATMTDILKVDTPSQSDGISFLPTLKGEKQRKHEYLYWEFAKGMEQRVFSQAVRMGKWKAYREKGKPMEIFNLDADPLEKMDIASRHPEIVTRMEAIIRKAHQPLR